MVDGGGLGARTPIAEVMPRPRETALEAWFPSLNSDHDRGERRWKRAFSPSKKKERKKITWLEETTLEALVSAAGTMPWESSADGIGARGLLAGNLCCVTGQASNRTRASFESKIGTPRQCCRRCRTAVELSIAVIECARLARECIFARVVGGSKAHSRSTSGGRRGGRAQDTTMVNRRVCGIVVTVYLALS